MCWFTSWRTSAAAIASPTPSGGSPVRCTGTIRSHGSRSIAPGSSGSTPVMTWCSLPALGLRPMRRSCCPRHRSHRSRSVPAPRASRWRASHSSPADSWRSSTRSGTVHQPRPGCAGVLGLVGLSLVLPVAALSPADARELPSNPLIVASPEEDAVPVAAQMAAGPAGSPALAPSLRSGRLFTVRPRPRPSAPAARIRRRGA